MTSEGPRKFNPQPIEVSTRSSRSPGKTLRAQPSTGSDASPPPKKQPRKFAPQLVETSRRSRKSTDDVPAVLPADRTDVGPSTTNARPVPPAPVNTPTTARHLVPRLKDAGPAHGRSRD